MLPVMEIIMPQQSGGNVPAFLAKLWKMVDNPDTGDQKQNKNANLEINSRSSTFQDHKSQSVQVFLINKCYC